MNFIDFKKNILNSKNPVLIDFYADWCSPCKIISPILDELDKTNKNKIKIIKLNIKENKKLADQYQVMSIPNLIFFKNGQKINQLVGSISKQKIQDTINTVIHNS